MRKINIMEDKSFSIKLFSGQINKDMLVNYTFKYVDDRGIEGTYPTVKMRDSNHITINNSYGLGISEGFGKNRIFIGSSIWYPFVTLLSKCVKLVSEHLYELFPDVNKTEFDIDSRTLERFQTEKAYSTSGITMVPCVWLDQTHQSYPAIRITIHKKNAVCVIPLEDAIPLSECLKHIDPNVYALHLLGMLGMFK